MKKWMIIKYNHSCTVLVEIRLGGIRTLHFYATWVIYGRGKFDQPEQYYYFYWKHMGKVWMSKTLNSRPLTIETFGHFTKFQPSFRLLIMNYKVVSPPSGRFLKPDVYSNIQWWHLQHICNVKNGQPEEEKTLEKVILFF